MKIPSAATIALTEQIRQWRAQSIARADEGNLKPGERWVTINGSPVLIDGHGKVVGGAGGKLDGKTLSKVGGKEEPKKEQGANAPESSKGSGSNMTKGKLTKKLEDTEAAHKTKQAELKSLIDSGEGMKDKKRLEVAKNIIALGKQRDAIKEQLKTAPDDEPVEEKKETEPKKEAGAESSSAPSEEQKTAEKEKSPEEQIADLQSQYDAAKKEADDYENAHKKDFSNEAVEKKLELTHKGNAIWSKLQPMKDKLEREKKGISRFKTNGAEEFKRYAEWAKKVDDSSSVDERSIMYRYAMEDEAVKINSLMRENDGDLSEVDEQTRRIIEGMDSLIAKNTLSEDLTLSRGVGLSKADFDAIKPGATIKNQGFWSTSVDPIISNEFAKQSKKKVKATFHILAKKGTHVAPGAQELHEVVLGRNTSVRVIHVDDTNDMGEKIKQVYVEVV